jgi:hypothetical protein
LGSDRRGWPVKNGVTNPALLRALTVSGQMFDAAEKREFSNVALLDAERLQLLKLFKAEAKHVDAGSQALLQQISQLNDRTIGLLEHQRRSKGREMDMAAVGRRAVAAYSNIRLPR